jgi:hypothetical protein
VVAAVDTWSVISSVASVLAATAALVTILYARATVQEAQRGRRESRANHVEAIAEQKTMAAAFSSAHAEQMADRQRAHDADARLQRLAQMERISELLLSVIDAARAEALEPPPLLTPPSQFRATRIPAMLARLGVALTILDQLAGPRLELASDLAVRGYGPGSNAMQVVGDAISALKQIESIVRGDVVHPA